MRLENTQPLSSVFLSGKPGIFQCFTGKGLPKQAPSFGMAENLRESS